MLKKWIKLKTKLNAPFLYNTRNVYLKCACSWWNVEKNQKKGRKKKIIEMKNRHWSIGRMGNSVSM